VAENFMRNISPLVFLISVLFLLGGFAGLFGPNPRLGAVYFFIGAVGSLWSARTWGRG
jgi:hypothetical protein